MMPAGTKRRNSSPLQDPIAYAKPHPHAPLLHYADNGEPLVIHPLESSNQQHQKIRAASYKFHQE